MLRNKKGYMSWSQIVIAAIAILVMIVVIMIFTGQFGRLSDMFSGSSDETGKQASRTNWCISTLTSGNKCEWEMSCSDIANALNGQSIPIKSPPSLETDCRGGGMIRTYSKSEERFCCVKK